MLEQFTRDLSFGFRLFMRKPGMSLLAVLALALGIGLTTTQFSVINGLFYKEDPWISSGEFYYLALKTPVTEEITMPDYELDAIPVDLFEQIRADETGLEDMTAILRGTVNISGDGTPERYDGAYVSYTYAQLFQAEPILGRFFTEEEEYYSDQYDYVPLVLSYDVWQSRFFGDPKVIGRELFVNGQEAKIVGVMPEGLYTPFQNLVWLPLKPRTSLTQFVLKPVVARLDDGADIDDVRQALDSYTYTSIDKDKSWQRTVSLTVQPFTYASFHPEADVWLWTIFAAAFLVLLIACANVANLLLARSTARSREIAIRCAVGATRRRIAVQLLVESMILSFFGAIGGLVITSWMVDIIPAFLNEEIPTWVYAPDINVVLFALALTVITGFISGVIPAWQSTRTQVNDTLKDVSPSVSSMKLTRFSKLLAVSQIALSCALLVGAGLTTRLLCDYQDRDPGYDASRLITYRMGLFESSYPKATDRIQFFQELEKNVSGQPGVADAGISSWISMFGSPKGTILVNHPASQGNGDAASESESTGTSLAVDLDLEEEGIAESDELRMPGDAVSFPPDSIQLTGDGVLPDELTVYAEVVSPSFFDTMEMPVIKGRNFSEDDTLKSKPVCIISESLAKQLQPDGNVLGLEVTFNKVKWETFKTKSGKMPKAEEIEWMSIVGVVPDVLTSGLEDLEKDRPTVYSALSQFNGTFMTLVVRASGQDPHLLTPMVKNQVLALDRHLPVYFVMTMQEYIDRQLQQFLFISQLFTAFGAAAMLLSSIGIYGVMTFSVAQRRQEIGIRMAVGAKGSNIIALILRQGLWQLLVGISIGVVLAYFVGKLISLILVYLRPLDPLTFLTVIMLLSSVALLACVLPALRAIRISPLRALRYE